MGMGAKEAAPPPPPVKFKQGIKDKHLSMM